MKKILMFTGCLLHYRIPVLNYISESFKREGFTLFVRSRTMENEQKCEVKFNYENSGIELEECARDVESICPDAVLLSLHLKAL